MPVGMGIQSVITTVLGGYAGQVFNVGMSVYGLSMGDPTGVLVLGITEIMKQVEQAKQREKDNYDPEKFRGKLYGKMRLETPEGEKWVPIITSSIKQDTGFGATWVPEMTVAYSPTGGPLLWGYDGANSVKPFFENEKTIRFL